MKFFLLLVSLTVAMSMVNATGLIAAAAVIIGAKILIGKGFVGGYLATRAAQRGGRRRFGRQALDTTDLSEAFLEASRKDEFDCAKMLVCTLNASPVHKLQAEELVIASTFGQGNAIDVTLPSVEFDVAAHMGRLAGLKQCNTIYTRCTVPVSEIMDQIKKTAYGS